MYIVYFYKLQILAVYDEVMALYQQLDLYKPTGSRIDKTTLLSLFNGGSWNRNFKNNKTTNKMENTAFNYTGFIQPKFLVEMLQREDQDGFYDRLMVACPPEIVVPFGDLQVPMPMDIVQLYEVFKYVRQLHVTNEDVIVYTFSQEAIETFAEMHDNLQQEKAETNDENRRGHLIKAITHLVRLAGIIHVLENAFDALKDGIAIDITTWNTTISVESLKRAWLIVEYTLKQKWALMPPSFDVPDATSDAEFLTKYSNRIVKFLSRSDFPITPSTAVRYRCIPTSVNASTGEHVKANVESAVAFMEKLEKLGFGQLTSQTSGRRQSTRFEKRKYDDLDEEAKEHLKKLRMSKDEFNNTEVDAYDIPSTSAGGTTDERDNGTASADVSTCDAT